MCILIFDSILPAKSVDLQLKDIYPHVCPTESTDQLWIGLNARMTAQLFDWSDHSTVRFTSWASQHPSVIVNNNNNCVLIRGEVKSTMAE